MIRLALALVTALVLIAPVLVKMEANIAATRLQYQIRGAW